MLYRSLLSTVLCVTLFILTGCGQSASTLFPSSPFNPPAVHAAAPPPPACDDNGACFYHTDFEWGYCHVATIRSAHTFSIAIEIGISKNITNPNLSLCNVPLASIGQVTSIQGNVDYKTWSRTTDGSMIGNLRACTEPTCSYPSGQEQLWMAKLGAPVGGHTAFSTSTLQFTEPIPADHFLLVFNDDLAGAKPTTMSFAFNGTLK